MKSLSNPARLRYERLQKGCKRAALDLDLEPAGLDDRLESSKRTRKIVIHQKVIVLSIMRDLIDGITHPPLDDLLGVPAPSSEPLSQRLIRWRQNEDADGPGQGC